MKFLVNGRSSLYESHDPRPLGRLVLAALLLVASISVLLQVSVSPARATTFSWTSVQNVPAGSWMAVAYGNGRWVAVASGGTNRLMTSSDGQTWTTNGLTLNGSAGGPVDGDWRTVRYANNMWLAAGFDGRVITSTDGLAWSSSGVTGLTTAEDIMSVAYKTGTWVAVGAASTVVTSSDGLSWSSAGVSGVPSSTILRSITWVSSYGKFFAVGDNSTVIYSADGLTWSNTNVTGIAAGQSLQSVASGVASNGNHRIVIVSPTDTNGRLWSSSTGETWSIGAANTNCASSQRWNAVGFGNGRWVAARGASGNCDSITSILGIQTSWEQTTGGTVAWWNAVAYGNGRWVAVASNAAMTASEPSLTPTFDTPVSTSTGFTVNVTNYNAAYFWGSAPTASAGTATWGTASGSTRPITVTGLTAGASATVSVTATRSGYSPGTASVTGSALVPVQSLSPATQTVSGTTGNLVTPTSAFTATGFSGAVTYTISSGSLPTGLQLNQSTGVITGNPSATSSATVTVTATFGSETATANITFAISGSALTPQFGAVTSTADGFTVNVTNYDSLFTWTPTTNAGSVVAGTAVGSMLPLVVTGLTAGTSATITVATSRSGYANGSATQSGTATAAASPATTVPATPTVVTSPSTTTTTTTTVPRPVLVTSPTAGQAPTLISSVDAERVVQSPGQVGAIVNGQLVNATVDVLKNPAAAVAPNQRTAEQINAVQQAAASLIASFVQSSSSVKSAQVSVNNTTTGAAITGLLVDPRDGVTPVAVPVENVVIMTVGNSKFLLAGASSTGDPLDLDGGTLRVGAGGVISVALNGLPANAPGEAVLFSRPTLLGSFTTSADGLFSGQFTVPQGLENGAHSLVIKVGNTTASFGIRVDNSVAQSDAMPNAGTNTMSVLLVALLLVFSGVMTRSIRRRIV